MPGPFSFSRLPDDNTSSDKAETRHRDLENTIGNLLVAEFQVKRLRERLRDYQLSTRDNMSSEFMYKLGEQWFRVAITAEKYTIPTTTKEEEKTISNKKKVQAAKHPTAEEVDRAAWTTGFAEP